MKKVISLLLATIMCISLTACNSKSQTNDNSVPQEMENNHNEESNNEDEKENSENNSEPKIVEITSENWTDYFEIVMEEGLLVEPDVPGESKKPDRIYNIVLKDGVVLSKKILDKVVFEFSYDEEKRFYEIDENGNLTWGDTEFIESKKESKRIDVGVFDPNVPEFMWDESTFPRELIRASSRYYNSGKITSGYIVAPNNVEITNVSGKLPLE